MIRSVKELLNKNNLNEALEATYLACKANAPLSAYHFHEQYGRGKAYLLAAYGLIRFTTKREVVVTFKSTIEEVSNKALTKVSGGSLPRYEIKEA